MMPDEISFVILLACFFIQQDQRVAAEHGDLSMTNWKQRRRRQTAGSFFANVINENEQPPAFLHPQCQRSLGLCTDIGYTASVHAGAAPPVVPLDIEPNQISAVDTDALSRPITYTFVNGTPASFGRYFYLNPQTGDLSQRDSVPYGLTNQFEMYIMAQENGLSDSYSVAKLTILVDNRPENNFDPELHVSALEGYIPENAAVGTTVKSSPDQDSDSLQLSVTDQDLKPGMYPATYQYILTGFGASVFAVNQNGYFFVNVPNLDADRPNPSTYQITIQAREVGTQPIRSSKPVRVRVNVIDANDNAPQFSSQVYTASVSAFGGSREVLKINATDGDTGPFGDIRYTILSVTNGGESVFRYNRFSGALTAEGSLTPGEQYQVLLQASDRGGRTAQAVILVSVDSAVARPIDAGNERRTTANPRSVNEAGFSEFTATVSEAVPPNTAVINLGVSGNREEVSYAIQSGNDEGRFSIDPTSGAIRTVGSLDRESRPTYRLVVQSFRPSDAVSTTAVVTVEVMDENDNPPIFLDAQPVIFQVPAAVPNALVGKLRVEDRDSGDNGRVTLTIVPPDQFFNITQDGTIRTLVGLPNDLSPYQLEIEARDNGDPPLQAKTTVSVNVERPALPPLFDRIQYTAQVSENVGPSFLVRVKAESSNSAPVTYILENGDPTLFSVDGVTGEVRTLSSLDAEQADQHVVVVSTKENTDHQPLPRSSATVTITVKDVNDWLPAFQPSRYQATLGDDAGEGTPVVQVTAADQDLEPPNNNFLYHFGAESNSVSSFFRLDSLTGLITVARDLKSFRSESQPILMHVIAVDEGEPPLSSTATIELTLQPSQAVSEATQSVDNTQLQIPEESVQFAMPFFTTSISEAVTPPFFVQILPVINKPRNPATVQCSIVSGNIGGVFSFGAGAEGNCELRTVQPLNRETTDKYLLNASVSLTTAATADFARVTVLILDSNDNEPEFHYNYDYLGHNAYFGAVASDAELSTTFLRINATDKDLGNNSIIRYLLDPLTPDNQYFALDPVKGDLMTAKRLGGLLGREPAYLWFRVEAKDSPSSGNSRSSKAEVFVNLIADAHRFMMTLEGILPGEARKYQKELQRTLQSFTQPCTLLGIEKMKESSELAALSQDGTDIYFYAVDPARKTICSRDKFSSLFSEDNVVYLRSKMSSWFRLHSLKQSVSASPVRSAGGSYFSEKWDAASVGLIVLGGILAVGSLIAIIIMCCLWSRYKASRSVTRKLPPQLYAPPPKYSALILSPSEKEYETQMLEVAVAEEDALNGKIQGQHNQMDLEFNGEEAIYSLQTAGRINPYSGRHHAPAFIIPPPDYPENGNHYSDSFPRPAIDRKTML